MSNPYRETLYRSTAENVLSSLAAGMMTANGFRRLALSLPEAVESSHMRHPDFRVRGKIFATLAYPDESRGMVKLTPEQQEEFVRSEPKAFKPVKGAWGLKGATSVHLREVRKEALRRAMAAAWCNAAPKPLAKDFEANYR